MGDATQLGQRRCERVKGIAVGGADVAAPDGKPAVAEAAECCHERPHGTGGPLQRLRNLVPRRGPRPHAATPHFPRGDGRHRGGIGPPWHTDEATERLERGAQKRPQSDPQCGAAAPRCVDIAGTPHMFRLCGHA